MAYYQFLWSNTQTRRVFNWTDILADWENTLHASSYITTVTNNLRAVSDPSSGVDFPLSHFLTFLNEEEDGVKWLIYEAVVLRWMYGNIRTDYITELVEYVDLDTAFPSFVGSPQGFTIRQFLEANLTEAELLEVHMMTPLIAVSNYQAYTAQPSMNEPVRVSKRHPSITMRFLRNKESTKDDVMVIRKAANDMYSVYYHDLEAAVSNKASKLNRQSLLKYLSSTLRLLQLATQPFQSIQFTAPHMPSVLLKTDLSSQDRDTVYDAVETVLNNWPVQA
jgi:hypothetical protein